MKAVTAFMVLVSLGIAGTVAYVSVSSIMLGMNVVDRFSSLMDGGGEGGESAFGMNVTNTTVHLWIPFSIENTGAVGFDMLNMTVKTAFKTNTTSVVAITSFGDVPFGTSKTVNITILDTTTEKAMQLVNVTASLEIRCSMTVAFPASWGPLALTISDLEFGFSIPLPGGLQFT